MIALMRSPWILLFAAGLLHAQAAKPAADTGADWPMYNRDLAGTRFSPLTQINTRNVANLKLAWSYSLKGSNASEATPIVVNGVMYFPVATRVVALEPETGKELWRYELKTGSPSRRGVTYWPGTGQIPARIIFTTGRNMMAL